MALGAPTHTLTHIVLQNEIDYKKPVACWPAAGARLVLKTAIFILIKVNILILSYYVNYRTAIVFIHASIQHSIAISIKLEALLNSYHH